MPFQPALCRECDRAIILGVTPGGQYALFNAEVEDVTATCSGGYRLLSGGSLPLFDFTAAASGHKLHWETCPAITTGARAGRFF